MNVKFLIGIFFFNSMMSQSVEFYGKVDYQMFLNFDSNQEYNSTLYFNDSISLFNYKYIDVNYEDEEKISSENSFLINSKTFIADTATYNIISKKKENLLLFKFKDLKTKTYYYVKEEIPLLKWNLLSDTKLIQSFECNLAETSFRGRKYYAWFTLSIPSNYGPWKLNGLPGLIIEAFDEKKEVIFTIKKIKIPCSNNIPIIDPSFPIIDINEYLSKRLNGFSELENIIKSKFDRGIKVKLSTVIKGIELDYNDIQKK